MCLYKNWQSTQDNSFLQIFSDRPLSYDVISEGMNPSLNGTLGKCLSGDGIAFWADHEPRMNAIISVELDHALLANCEEVEREILRINGSVVGKVSSIERNEQADEVIVKISFLKRNGSLATFARHELAVS